MRPVFHPVLRALAPVRALALAPLLSLWLPLAAAQAQSVQIPLPLDTTPGAPALEAVDLDRLQADRIAAEAHRGNYVEPSDAEVSIISPLRPIEAHGRPAGSAIRFDGERRTLQFALFVPQPDQVRALRISTLSSINVLPERSHFRVFVNDTLVGDGRLENFTAFGAADFPLGAATVLPGQNNVRVELVEYHRIYCGPDASFALWSDIDLANSGAVLASAEGISGQDGFLMGLAGAAATGAGIEIRGAEGLGDYRDDWVSQITQRISSALGGDPIPFRFTPYWSVQGQRRSAARVTFLPSTQNRLGFRTAGDGAQVMVVEFVPGERPHALPEFETLLPPVARRAQPRLIATQRPVALSEMGFHTTEAFDRYTLIQQRFRLPDDYVVLTNDKAELALDYFYIPDLPAGSALLVHVNGTNIRLLPLRGEGGQVIEQFPIRFEARLLRSGINTLAFEAMVPGDPPDLPCPIAEAPFLTIGENSTLSVPYSPSMYLADMHLAFAGLTPASVTTNDMTGRSFDADDVVTLRAALSGGERPEAAMLAPRLTLLSIDDFGSIPNGGYRIDRRAVEQALTPPPAPETAVAAATVGTTPGNLFSAMTDRRGTGSPAALSQGWDWLVSGVEAALQWLQPQSGVLLDEWLVQQHGQAMLVQLDPGRPNQIWMLRAPGSDISAIASAIVAARTTTESPRGQVSILGYDGQWHSWTAPDRQPVLLEPISPGNIRHVVGNFVSAMPIRYVTGLFFLALISALFALRLVISTREHRS